MFVIYFFYAVSDFSEYCYGREESAIALYSTIRESRVIYMYISLCEIYFLYYYGCSGSVFSCMHVSLAAIAIILLPIVKHKVKELSRTRSGCYYLIYGRRGILRFS